MKIKLYVLWVRFKANFLFWTRIYKQHQHELKIMKANHKHLKWSVDTWGSHKENNKDIA